MGKGILTKKELNEILGGVLYCADCCSVVAVDSLGSVSISTVSVSEKTNTNSTGLCSCSYKNTAVTANVNKVEGCLCYCV